MTEVDSYAMCWASSTKARDTVCEFCKFREDCEKWTDNELINDDVKIEGYKNQ